MNLLVANDAVVTALTTVSTTMIDTIEGVAPVGLTVTGTYLVWKMAIKFFKGLAKG